MNIALIPARGGSKRIPKKNIKLFAGKPMIFWPINAAIKSKVFDRIIVSTDDKEIAKIAIDCGAEVPFFRPSNLSDDHTNTQSVVVHFINWLEQNSLKCKFICCLYATAPFVIPSDLCEAQNLINNRKDKNYIFSATSFPFPIQRAFKINEKGKSQMFQPEFFNYRSQDLEEAFHDAGQFYWASPNTWKIKTNFFEDSIPFLLPRWRVQDIDTNEDWLRAELMYKLINNEKN